MYLRVPTIYSGVTSILNMYNVIYLVLKKYIVKTEFKSHTHKTKSDEAFYERPFSSDIHHWSPSSPNLNNHLSLFKKSWDLFTIGRAMDGDH